MLIPALKNLREYFKNSSITLMVEPKVFEIVENCPYINEVIVFKKEHLYTLKNKIRFIKYLQKQNYDVAFIMQRSFSSAFFPFCAGITERIGFDTDVRGFMLTRKVYYDKEDYEVECFLDVLRCAGLRPKRYSYEIWIGNEEREYIKKFLDRAGVLKFLIINPGASVENKCWQIHKYAELADRITSNFGLDVVITWGPDEYEYARQIFRLVNNNRAFLACATNLKQLAALIEKSEGLVTTDTGPLHMAAALNKPVVALFGPTNPFKWMPRGKNFSFIKKQVSCWPCEYKKCVDNKCMRMITVEDVLIKLKSLLKSKQKFTKGISEVESPLNLTEFVYHHHGFAEFSKLKKILVIETSTVGEVVLITPVLSALRATFPQAKISVMIIPATRGVLCADKNVDEIVVYDKKNKHKSWKNFLKLIKEIRSRKFDIAILLHRSFRSALIAWLSGIPLIIGCPTEFRGLFLTHKVPVKDNLFQHELEKNLDVIKIMGIDIGNPEAHFFIDDEAMDWALKTLQSIGIFSGSSKMVIINPGAGWETKRWAYENFAITADALKRKFGFNILLTWGPSEYELAKKVATMMKEKAFIAPFTDLQKLAALLSYSQFVITNDTGPMHIAAALQIPVIAIMGPTSKQRWGPYSENFIVVKKDFECTPCFKKKCHSMKCMKSIKPLDVLQAVDKLLMVKKCGYE